MPQDTPPPQPSGSNIDLEKFYNFILTSGFRIFEYQEEPEYAQSFDSWRGKAPSARYHFVEMITEGGHGINRPLQNFEIVQFHPDLSIQEIQSLTELFETNEGIRPFKQPMQISKTGLPENSRNDIKSNLEGFYNLIKEKSPKVERIIPPFIGATLSPRPAKLTGTSIKTMLSSLPNNPEVGDLWFNSSKGKYFAYLSDGISKYWVEV